MRDGEGLCEVNKHRAFSVAVASILPKSSEQNSAWYIIINMQLFNQKKLHLPTNNYYTSTKLNTHSTVANLILVQLKFDKWQ